MMCRSEEDSDSHFQIPLDIFIQQEMSWIGTITLLICPGLHFPVLSPSFNEIPHGSKGIFHRIHHLLSELPLCDCVNKCVGAGTG